MTLPQHSEIMARYRRGEFDPAPRRIADLSDEAFIVSYARMIVHHADSAVDVDGIRAYARAIRYRVSAAGWDR